MFSIVLTKFTKITFCLNSYNFKFGSDQVSSVSSSCLLILLISALNIGVLSYESYTCITVY